VLIVKREEKLYKTVVLQEFLKYYL
jgi:hypothetical protein